MASEIQVCFVCLGNICRSPTAEGVMQAIVEQAGLADRIKVDSAGTAAYHVGERADPRSRKEARRRGVELTSVGRQFEARDFDRFDYVVAMDRRNLASLERLAPDAGGRARLSLLRDFEPREGRRSASERDVPDPYYGGPDGFAHVFELVERACRGLLAAIVAEHGL